MEAQAPEIMQSADELAMGGARQMILAALELEVDQRAVNGMSKGTDKADQRPWFRRSRSSCCCPPKSAGGGPKGQTLCLWLESVQVPEGSG